MPIINVQHCLRNFENSVVSAMDLLDESDSYRILHNTGAYIKIPVRRKELFASLSLLRMQLAWESFVEDVFVRYMCGAVTASGYSPILISMRCGNTKESSVALVL